MNIWKYIGEFFLFRWLFGSHKHNETNRDIMDTATGFTNMDIIDDNDSHVSFGSRYDDRYFRNNNQDYGYSQSHDDFHDEQDDYDMMDDDLL